MVIETNVCVKQKYNSHMGTECYSDSNTIFYFDRNGWVKVGDTIKCERDEKGFYKRIWVNDVVKLAYEMADKMLDERKIK